jgi:outer membrane protein
MKQFQSALFGLIIAGVVGLRPDAAEAAQSNIGYVNLQRAIVETEDGKRAKAELERTFKKKQKALRAKEKELEAMRERLRASKMKQDDPKARAKILEFQKKFLALRQTLMKEQKELKQLEEQALSKITKKLRRIIKRIGKREGYLMIMEAQESSLLFAKAHLDLTNEVIRKYNARYGK